MLYINNPYTDAWFNLAAEEYLLKNFSDDIFMLWQNEPSVIIGKHQNVWDEINRNYIQEKHIRGRDFHVSPLRQSDGEIRFS